MRLGPGLAHEPPARGVLAWQISARWQHDPEATSEVEVRFVADEDRTRVELEHRGRLEAFGDAADQKHAVFDGQGGWEAILEDDARAVAA